MTTAVLLVGALMAIVNWYLKSEGAFAWAASLAVLASMAIALRIGGRRHRDAVTLGGLMVTISLTAPLAVAFGIADHDFSERAIMIMSGVFFTVTGNTLPKTLVPLTAHGDPTRVQSCRRITGWIWVLTGLALIGVALALPLETATRVSLVLMATGVAGTLTQMARVRRPRQQSA
jgi:hypothetical protein